MWSCVISVRLYDEDHLTINLRLKKITLSSCTILLLGTYYWDLISVVTLWDVNEINEKKKIRIFLIDFSELYALHGLRPQILTLLPKIFFYDVQFLSLDSKIRLFIVKAACMLFAFKVYSYKRVMIYESPQKWMGSSQDCFFTSSQGVLPHR